MMFKNWFVFEIPKNSCTKIPYKKINILERKREGETESEDSKVQEVQAIQTDFMLKCYRTASFNATPLGHENPTLVWPIERPCVNAL